MEAANPQRTDGTEVVTDLDSLLAGGRRFRTLYADPPWRFSQRRIRGACERHYKTLTLDELKSMPVSSLAEENAHLFLWAVASMLPEAIDLLTSWGFAYRTNAIWHKSPGKLGLGRYFRTDHEHLLLGVRGSLPFQDHSLRSVITARRMEHSRKPEVFRLAIERASPPPYLELFGRRAVSGWVVHGNEVDEALLFA